MERALLVMLKTNFHDHVDYKLRLDELESLARTAGYEVIGRILQTGKPRPKYLIGSGKAREIKEIIERERVDLVIFENSLKTSQAVALEELWGVPVIDRFDLILNVFEKHARTREAKLQIELVRLRKKLPYLKMMLGRKVREEHPGFGGMGEFIVHSTITSIKKRIARIEEQLRSLELKRDIVREKRKEIGKIVSLAGYTNSGKSTLMKRLTGEDVICKNELFTTLTTRTASLKYDHNESKVLINDTIGFIRNLPHELVYAFRATLSDIRNSDLILLVLDVSDPLIEIKNKLETCLNTLESIGAGDVPILGVANKIDLVGRLELRMKLNFLDGFDLEFVPVSAKRGWNLDLLKRRILEHLGLESSSYGDLDSGISGSKERDEIPIEIRG